MTSGAISSATALAASGRLARFELKGLLGAGGMGEVYRAHDPTLGRDVALKILPSVFLEDADRRARFDREARVLAALSHPHIAAIYGIETLAPEPGGPPLRALVLELVEGETLADRLARGAMPIGEALDVARQIADALEAAHDKGIVHRDLKPANVKVRADGVIKVLDFGLAKADPRMFNASSGTEAINTPAATAAGMILGTPAYMSPEQARGLTVDKRADIWAFGAMLYEMLVGTPPFVGTTPADVLAAVLHRPVDWSALPPGTPASVQRLLRRCLERDLKRRLRDIGDAWLDLEDDDRELKVAARSSTPRAGLVVASVATGAALLIGAWAIGMLSPSVPPPVQFTFAAPEGQILAGLPVPSPDGSQLVFTSRTPSGESALWTRPLGRLSAQRLAGTDNGVQPFWSPDGRFVGFIANGAIKRTSLAGGPVQQITTLEPSTQGAAWSADNSIVFTPSNRAPLYRIAATGGAAEAVTTLDANYRENSHRWPHFLPDGRHYLFTARSDLLDQSAIYVAAIDNPIPPRRLLETSSSARYVSSGHLLFIRQNTLFAQPFDLRTMDLSGEPIAIAGDVLAIPASASADFATSSDGRVLTFNTMSPSRLVWLDRSGVELGSVGARGDFAQIRLAPDGAQAAVVMPDPQGAHRDVWVVALATGALTRLTSHPASDWFPVWSPNSDEVIFASDRDRLPAFYRTSSSGGGNEQLVYRGSSPESIFPTDWVANGREIVFHSYPRGDISRLPLTAGAAPVPLVASPFTDWVASVSPDGRWLAYISDESGRDEVYVREFAGSDRYPVSVNGGIQARWRRDGRELFFLAPNNQFFVVAPDADGTFRAARPRLLFTACGNRKSGAAPFMYRYDVAADGARSLWICAASDEVAATVSVNGLAALARTP
jgi:serine/threonine protein kinase